MTTHEAVKALHLLSVALWIGGGATLQLLSFRVRRLGPDYLPQFVKSASWLSQTLFMPASFAALGFGIWLVVIGPWTFADAWILVGLIGFVASSLNGMIVLGPTGKRVDGLIDERGPTDPEVQALTKRLFAGGRVDLLILVIVLLDMVVKPGAV